MYRTEHKNPGHGGDTMSSVTYSKQKIQACDNAQITGYWPDHRMI